MSTKYIACTTVGSKFAKALQQGLQTLGIKSYRVDHKKAEYHASRGKAVFYVTHKTLNKLQQLEAFTKAGVPCPKYTTRKDNIKELESKVVLARTVLNGTNGEGIVEFPVDSNDIPEAPLYTGYIPKEAEYRVHVFNGQVIDKQQKRKRRDAVEANYKVRNVSNGFIYARSNITDDARLGDIAVAAVSALGYQYGACDIIYNRKLDSYFVLEVNSRPGLEGQTVESYAKAIKELL